MRRPDWILAGLVAAFLVGVVLVEASANATLGGQAISRARPPGEVEAISLKRLVGRPPTAPILTGDAR